MNKLNKGKKTMSEFKSIIVFDTETTGIPYQENNLTRFTELAMVACEVRHCMLSEDLPRVLHKYVVCFNPLRKVSPGAADTSGLDNEILDCCPSFNKEVAESILKFINMLQPPVCFVAHNGNKFDFPLLQRALLKCDVKLPDELYCGDSLPAFRQLFPKPKPSKFVKELQNKNEDVICLLAAEVTENILMTPVKKTMQEINETTPKRQTLQRELFTLDSDVTPVKKRKCNTELIAPRSYKLRDVHNFLTGKHYEAHRAEEDCLALLQCITARPSLFFDWLTENAVLFSTIKPLF